MSFVTRVGDGERPGMVRIGCFWLAAIILTAIGMGETRADSPEMLTQRVRNALRQQGLKRVALAVLEDGAGQADDETRAGIAELARHFEAAGRQLGIGLVTLKAGADLGSISLTDGPDTDNVKTVMQSSNTDAVLAVVWKSTKSGVAVRVSLSNDRKALWNNRTVLSKPSLLSQGTGKAKSNSSMAKKNSGVSPLGATAGLNAAGNAALGSSLPFTGNGLGTLGGIGLAGAGNCAGEGGAASGPVPDLNSKILEFAVSQTGKQVGNGECWTLAAEALKYAGAKPPNIYDFGTEVGLAELLPGDILHFETASFVTPTYSMTMGAPDHVAIVGAVNGTKLLIYHQNFNGDRRVQTITIDLSTLVSGSITGYRAEAGAGGGAAAGKSCKKPGAGAQATKGSGAG